MNISSLMRIWLTKSFKPFEFTNIYTNKLDFENLEQLGLYVHIPFCKQICSFCPYCKVVYNKEIATKYKQALLKEIDLVGSSIKDKKEVISLYFGGGTPALMINELGEIIKNLKKYFNIIGGIGVELHPDDVTIDNLTLLKNSGVTMISIGIQSFNNDCLKSLGRKETDYNRIFNAIKTVKFETVDMDLIFAIPNQTTKTLKQDIKTAFANGATQISTYPFIDFTFANNKYKPLAEKEKKIMLDNITKYCKKINVKRTSVWTFAKENSKKYSSITRDNFLGFGVSATSLLKTQFKINTFSIEGYIERVNKNLLPTSLTLDFSVRQRMAYYLFWSAYGMIINKKSFKKYFDIDIKKLFRLEIFFCKLFGLIKENGNIINLTDKGAYYYHYIEQAYTTAYIDKMWNISRTIPFPEKITLK